jgi:hypothetical protein
MPSKQAILAFSLVTLVFVALAIVVATGPEEKQPAERQMSQTQGNDTGISGPRVYAPVEPSEQKKDEKAQPEEKRWQPGDPVRERRDLKGLGDTPPK